MPFFLYSFVYLVMVVMIGKEHGGMVASWNPDAEPVEIKIEVYGLGRYYGLHGGIPIIMQYPFCPAT